jgi:hypothetical protein
MSDVIWKQNACCTTTAYRGLARDVINDVTDGRRHIGGIFLRRTGHFNWNVSIGPDKWPIFGRFLTLFPLKRPAPREKNTSNMADVRRWRHRVTSLQVLYTLLICEEIIWIHPAVLEELRGNEIPHRFYPETIQPIHIQIEEWYGNEMSWFIKGLPSTQQWSFHPKLQSHLAAIIKYRKYH